MSLDLHHLLGDSSGCRAFGSPEFRGGPGAGPPPGSGDGPGTTELVDEMVAAWRRGEPLAAEAFLERHPGLGTESALRLIHEEVCLRQEAGLAVVTAEVVDRFPRWRAQLELLLDCQHLLQPAPRPHAPPAVGEVLGEFRLVAELGRGASGPVFLASQDSLAARPVVLKMITCAEEEHLTLAQLQHMNIVPLYSEEVISARRQRLLCMPYLGGATLARLLDLLRDTAPPDRTGKQLIEALDRIQAEVPVGFSHQGPYRGTLARSGYVQAIAWVGACLADGLQYAHDRGLVHMDIKPSNVLLTGDGQPMLLDFHLARGAIDPAAPPPSGLGGTRGYASPEQRAAMAAIRDGGPIHIAVDGRSDIYSLGVLLYEALGGLKPGRGRSGAHAPLRRLNPEVSTGLSDIIHKCLNADPRGRYAHASALASDLRRHLNHLPLAGVPNRSWIERWRKWRQRRPSALARQVVLVLSACGVIAATALLVGAYRQRLHDLNDALERSRRCRAGRQFAEAEATLDRALALAGPTLAFEDWRRLCRAELRVILRDRKAAELHQLADMVRYQYGLAPRPSEASRSLLDRGRAIWEARTLLLAPIPGRSEPDLERMIRTDLLDIIAVWADLRVRLAPAAEAAAARGEALARLDEAAAVLGPGPALERLRRALCGELGRTTASAATATSLPEPKTAWEHCDLGCAYLREGEDALAARQFDQAVDLEPRSFWPNFYQGICSYRLRRFEEALTAFRVCIALAPDPAECYFNRALTYEALGRDHQAVLDYNRALRSDGRLTGAALNRGILHYKAGCYPEAAADFDRALATTSGRELRGLIQYNRALVELARNHRAAALTALEIATDCGHARARELYNRIEHDRSGSEKR
jgi:serine/threonine protein kinase/tetratricopeptide (TPR) repeat protein